jgi:hypothetical protein
MRQSIEFLGAEDLSELEAMRSWVRNHYSPDSLPQYESVSGKLKLLATILGNNWVEPSETIKLHSLGISFGDALAQELGLAWVIVEDDYGRDPALCMDGTSILLFPKTMISKRIEAGESVDIYSMFGSICSQVGDIRRDISN